MKQGVTASLFLALVIAQSVFASRQTGSVQYINVARTAGISFKHENGASSEKYMPETMAAGAIIFDFDADGLQDLFFINGGSFVNPRVAMASRHRLYRNTGSGKFADMTESSGIGMSGFGMGACSADYNNDGLVDLYVTAFDSNRLYRNSGKGAFVDVTQTARTAAGLWSTSCAFADIDNDGDVDLYVTRYVDFARDNNKYCRLLENVRAYCHPNEYRGVPDLLFRNNGDGTFTDVSRDAGITKIGNGLGVVFGDYDEDGWIDIYVANDSTPNFLYRNKGKGVFEEVGFWSGVAVGHDGKPLAGMGTDMGDMNGDGLLDILVTNLDGQTHSLYKNIGKGLFADVTFPSGVGEATLPFVGFGTAFVVYDNDSDLDLAIANGDVIDNVQRLRDSTSYEQLNLLLQNDGTGRFKSVGASSGPGFAIKKASRALATGDLDNDGDLDILVSNVGDSPDLLQNEGGNRANSILVRIVGVNSNRDGIGARVKFFLGEKTLMRHVKAGSSYLSQNDLRVHFGLGDAPRANHLEVHWPGGGVDRVDDVSANQILTVREGAGVISRQPYHR